MKLDELLPKLQKVKHHTSGEYEACCPAHDDRKQSLCLKEENDHILITCQAGCKTEDVVAALGLKMSDLFLDKDEHQKPPPPAAKIVATYDYLDENRTHLFQVVRYDPKSFRQRHRNGGGEWVWNLDGVKRVLYHLPDILETAPGPVVLVEGEKDADNLWAAAIPATTAPGGANNWRHEYASSLVGRKVIIIPDKDSAGYNYAREAARSLEGRASEIKAIILPGAAKDVSEWLITHSASELADLEQDVDILFDPERPVYRRIDELILWDKAVAGLGLQFKAEKISEDRTGIHARVTIYGNRVSLAWTYLNVERSEDRVRLANSAHAQIKGDVTKQYSKDDLRRDLDNFCLGLWQYYVSGFVPEDLSGSETITPLSFLLRPYIMSSAGTILYAPPGRSKSFTALLWAISIDAGCSKFWPVQQENVLFINLERSRDSIVRRLSMVNRVLGLPPTRPLYTLNARGKSLIDVIPACRKAISARNIGLIVLDSISRAGLGDLNENMSGNRIIDALSALCPSWLALGHTSRANEDHLFGSIMQEAGADICIQISSQVKNEGALLGTGWQITKQNDIGYHKLDIYAFEFSENGLSAFRRAKPFEFPDIEGKSPQDMESTIIDWISNQDSGDATATEVSKELGFNRINVVRFFTKSGRFIETRRVKQSVYYGLKTEKLST